MRGLNAGENAGKPVLGSRVDRVRGGMHRSVMGGDLVAQNAIGLIGSEVKHACKGQGRHLGKHQGKAAA